jgi:hypothetical protein
MVWQYPLAGSSVINQVEQVAGIVLNITHHSFPHEINRPIPHLLAQDPTSPRQGIVAEEWNPGMNVLY